MDHYIVKIYRCEKNSPRGLVGVVEEVGAKGKTAFTSYDELWKILNAGGKTHGRVKKISGEAGRDKKIIKRRRS